MRSRAFALAVAIVLSTLGVSLVNPGFLSPASLVGLISSMAPIVIVAIGLALVVICGEIDISVGTMFGTLAAVLAVLASPSHAGLPAWAAVGIVIGGGAAAGFVNGALTVWGRVPSIVATLGTMSIFRGVTEFILGGNWVTDLPADLRYLGTGAVVGVPICVWVATVVALAGVVLSRRSRVGVRLFAVGDHAEAARMSRVGVNTTKLMAFTLCGMLVGVAVAVGVPRLSVVEAGLGVGMELAAVTAIVVGGVSIRGGVGSLAGVALAAVMLGMLRSMLVFLKLGEAATFWEQAIQGVCILAAVLYDRGGVRGADAPLAGSARTNPLPIAGVLAMVLMIAWWMAPEFVEGGAQASLMPQVAEVALLAVPMALVILAGGIDLSVGASMALAAVFAGMAFERGAPPVVAASVAVVTGCACGMVNGFFVTRARIHPLVVTLATMALFRGLAEGFSAARAISGFTQGWTALGTARVLGVPVVLMPALVAAAVAAVFLAKSTWGFALRATGVSERAARYCALPVDGLKFLAYSLSGGAAGVAACLFIARRNTAKADIGLGIELDVITACLLGGISLTGGRGGIVGVVLGVALIHEIRQFVAWRWYHDELIHIVLGVLLIGSVMLATFVRSRLARGPVRVPMVPKVTD